MDPPPAEPPLPFVDEHALTIAASPERSWDALASVLPRAFGGRRGEGFARLVGCADTAARGPFPAEGSAIVGFRVARAESPRELTLVGQHRFSRYELSFRLEPADDGRATLANATTRAEFPGAMGGAYRLAVIGTRGHLLVVRRLLRAVARRAER